MPLEIQTSPLQSQLRIWQDHSPVTAKTENLEKLLPHSNHTPGKTPSFTVFAATLDGLRAEEIPQHCSCTLEKLFLCSNKKRKVYLRKKRRKKNPRK
jgi:hypothetical protein